jgi:hypothetical protein
MKLEYTVFDSQGLPSRYIRCTQEELSLKVRAGETYQIGRVQSKEKENFRLHRDALLKNTDWTQLPDSPLNEEQKAAWAEYRQALRDITETNAEFPIQPNS